MRNVAIFLLGVLLICATVVGVRWYLQRHQQSHLDGALPGASHSLAVPSGIDGSETVQPGILPEQPVGKPGPPEKILMLKVQVLVPPPLQTILAGKKEVLLSVRALLNPKAGPPGTNLLRASDDIEVHTWPYEFSFLVNPDRVNELLAKRDVDIMLSAHVCYDVPKPSSGPSEKFDAVCGNNTTPAMVGLRRITASFSDQAAGIQAPSVAVAPPLTITRIRNRVDAAACSKSGGRISGSILATGRFMMHVKQAKAYELLAIPLARRRPPPPFYSEFGTASPAKKEDLAALGEHGIVRISLPPPSETPTPFSLKVPDAFRDAQYNLILSSCVDGQSEDDCTLAAFPVASTPTERDDVSLFRLIPQNFEHPRCGTKNVTYYLHKFEPNSAPASQESLQFVTPSALFPGAY